MIERLLDLALPSGIFAVLFIWLLYTTNKRNEVREAMYQNIIKENQLIINTQAKAFNSLSGEVKDIKLILKKDKFSSWN